MLLNYYRNAVCADDGTRKFLQNGDLPGVNIEWCVIQISPGISTVPEDSPLIFSTVQLYVPPRLTDGSMVSTAW